MIDQGAADQEKEPLSHISEHDAEDKGVSQPDEHRGIDLIVSRESVHLDEHLERFEQLRILQFGRRFPEVGVMVILNHHEHLIIVLDLF